MRVSSYLIGMERSLAASASWISSSARAWIFGCVNRNREVEPRAVPVVSAPAWMRMVMWERL